MNGIYALAAAVGLPLIAWFIFAGDGEDGFGSDGGEGLGGGEDGGLFGSDGALANVSLATMAFFLGFFGLGGLIFDPLTDQPTLTVLLAVMLGLLAAGAQSAIFGYLRRSSSSSHLTDSDLEGRRGRVVLPIEAGRRGRISVLAGEQEMYFTARAEDSELVGGSLDLGAPVVVVNIENGVAVVARLDAELS